MSEVTITVQKHELYNGYQVLLCNGGMCAELHYSSDEDNAHNEAHRIAREANLKLIGG